MEDYSTGKHSAFSVELGLFVFLYSLLCMSYFHQIFLCLVCIDECIEQALRLKLGFEHSFFCIKFRHKTLICLADMHIYFDSEPVLPDALCNQLYRLI